MNELNRQMLINKIIMQEFFEVKLLSIFFMVQDRFMQYILSTEEIVNSKWFW